MITHCPITGVNLKYFALTLLCGFVFIFAYDFIVHGMLLTDLYMQTPHLWRTVEDMANYRGFMMVMQLATVAISALIFTRHYEGKGIGEGVRFGVLLGLLMGAMMAASYAWSPIPSALAAAWFFSGLGLGLGLGVVFSFTYRQK